MGHPISVNEQGVESRRFDYEDRTAYVVDFGPSADVTLDVVDDTAIVVVDGKQYDIDLSENAQVFKNNGLVTIEVKA